MENILKALSFATNAHKDQVRKSTGNAFITHPMSVAVLLASEGCSEEVVIAGILHDVVEDTPIELEEIEEVFGKKVANLVWCASEPNKDLSWEERKIHTIETMKMYSLEEKMVICADKIHNVTSLIEDKKVLGENIWDGFKRGKEQQKWYYTSIYNSLCEGISEPNIPRLFVYYKKSLDQLF